MRRDHLNNQGNHFLLRKGNCAVCFQNRMVPLSSPFTNVRRLISCLHNQLKVETYGTKKRLLLHFQSPSDEALTVQLLILQLHLSFPIARTLHWARYI